MRSRVIEEYKKNLFLTLRQKQILIGLLLGDAHLENQYRSGMGRLKIEHSYKQKDYVDWLYGEFRGWVRTSPRKRERLSWGKPQNKYGFTTYGHKLLGKFRDLFYNRDGRKIVPKNIESYLTPLSLAIWFMDDGSIKSVRHKGMFLNTQAFRVLEVKRLQKALKKKFLIETIVRKDKSGFQIYILGKSADNFMKLIRPRIIPSMEYKIPRLLR